MRRGLSTVVSPRRFTPDALISGAGYCGAADPGPLWGQSRGQSSRPEVSFEEQGRLLGFQRCRPVHLAREVCRNAFAQVLAKGASAYARRGSANPFAEGADADLILRAPGFALRVRREKLGPCPS